MSEFILSIDDLVRRARLDNLNACHLRNWVQVQGFDEDILRRMLTYLWGLDPQDAKHLINEGWWRVYDAALPAS